MDQTVLAGIGNIVATEGLWHARIDPRSRSDALSRADVVKIAHGLERAVRKQLAMRETRRGRVTRRVRGLRPLRHAVPEVRVRARVGGRTTAFCAQCQIRK